MGWRVLVVLPLGSWWIFLFCGRHHGRFEGDIGTVQVLLKPGEGVEFSLLLFQQAASLARIASSSGLQGWHAPGQLCFQSLCSAAVGVCHTAATWASAWGVAVVMA